VLIVANDYPGKPWELPQVVEEASAYERALSDGGVPYETLHNKTAAQFRAALDAMHPTVVIFCGHGDLEHGGGLALGFVSERGGDGRVFDLVDHVTMAGYLLAHPVRLLLLNACKTQALAHELVRAVVQRKGQRAALQHVICWSTRAADEAARTFGVSLVQRHLVGDECVASAYENAKGDVTDLRVGDQLGTGHDADVQMFKFEDPDAWVAPGGSRTVAAGLPVHVDLQATARAPASAQWLQTAAGAAAASAAVVAAAAALAAAEAAAHAQFAEATVAVEMALPAATPKAQWSSTPSCEICSKGFGILRMGRHHCRHCGKSVCASCSPHSMQMRESYTTIVWRWKSAKCPGNHDLTSTTTTSAGFVCNLCRYRCREGVTVHSCRICDFDVCHVCTDTRTRYRRQEREQRACIVCVCASTPLISSAYAHMAEALAALPLTLAGSGRSLAFIETGGELAGSHVSSNNTVFRKTNSFGYTNATTHCCSGRMDVKILEVAGNGWSCYLGMAGESKDMAGADPERTDNMWLIECVSGRQIVPGGGWSPQTAGRIKKGSVVTFIHDASARTLRYLVDGKHHGPAFDGVRNRMKLCILMGGMHAVQLL
jgi:hypothetical protein